MSPETPPVTKPLEGFLEGNLDAKGLEKLRDDILAGAHVIRCRQKGSAAGMSTQSASGVRQAFESLAKGELRALQLEYAVGGEVWSDTLVHHAGRTRLVRTRVVTEGGEHLA